MGKTGGGRGTNQHAIKGRSVAGQSVSTGGVREDAPGGQDALDDPLAAEGRATVTTHHERQHVESDASRPQEVPERKIWARVLSMIDETPDDFFTALGPQPGMPGGGVITRETMSNYLDRVRELLPSFYQETFEISLEADECGDILTYEENSRIAWDYQDLAGYVAEIRGDTESWL
ncbi:hypothetical protein [Cellulosimicrobium sp. SL-1]|uniref:hypothetical protein n=1 Tax=Cellulosimicrobium sp. SL-1 TaxID=2699423 RepID=UPI0013D16F17|nr:hypothetical protein [Cellulosimicrobium sp. SL-1]